MKAMVYRTLLLWFIVFGFCALLLSQSGKANFEQLQQSKQNWLQTQQALIHQKLLEVVPNGRVESINELNSLALIPSVTKIRLLNGVEESLLFEKSFYSEEGFSFHYPVTAGADRPKTLEVTVNASPSITHAADTSLYSFFIILLIGFGVALQWRLFKPMLHLEEKAESILTGDFNPEHYISTDAHPSTSELAINLLLNEHQRNKEKQAELSNKLRQHSFVDEVTGLGNREYFDAELEVHLHSESDGLNGAVVLFSFEPLSDLYHDDRDAFNQIMKAVGDFFHRFCNEEDLCWVARRGPMDFALLTLENAPEKIKRLCKQVVHDLDRAVFDSTDYHHHFISVGATFFSSGDEPYTVLSSADMSLRHAQLEGENCIHMYTPQKLSKSVIRGGVRWRSFLQSVLDRKQVILYFQPNVFVKSNNKARYEVLSRINDRGKMIAASVFLPMANRCGLAADFDRLIIDMALQELSHGKDFADVELCINIFPESLMNQKFLDWLYQRLSMNGALNQQVIFEITEFAACRNLAALNDAMRKIKRFGCRWCVEHVGSPNADLSYMTELPIDTLKLSQSIVRHIDEQSDKQLFIQSLASTANNAGIQLWAEGVESEKEWKVLTELGVHGGQGFWFGPPQEKLFIVEGASVVNQ